MGQEATGDCRGHRLARSFALALRRAGLHGIGHAGQDAANGWLNRALPATPDADSPLRAVALANQVPRTLRGEQEAIALGNVQHFKFRNQDRLAILQNMYSRRRTRPCGAPARMRSRP